MHVDRIVLREAARVKGWVRGAETQRKMVHIIRPNWIYFTKWNWAAASEVMTLFILITKQGSNEATWLTVIPHSCADWKVFFSFPFLFFDCLKAAMVSSSPHPPLPQTPLLFTSLWSSDYCSIPLYPSLCLSLLIVGPPVASPPVPLSLALSHFFSSSLPPTCLLSWFAVHFFSPWSRLILLAVFVFKRDTNRVLQEHICMMDSAVKGQISSCLLHPCI